MMAGMMGRLAAVALSWAMLTGVCVADYAVYTRSKPDSDGGLLAFFGGNTQRIEAHVFNAAEYELCIVDEGDGQPKYGTLERAMKAHRCCAGVNGGYFAAGAARKPLGLVRHGGVSIAPFARGAFTVSGVVYDTGRGVGMERSTQLRTPVSSMTEGIQGGPFLVEQGRVVPGLEATKSAARTFIATDGKGRWCLAVSSSLTLRELAEWLVQKGAMGDFHVAYALNLDGGSSSAFWDEKAGVSRSGFKAVRNYVGVRRRAATGGK